MLPGEKANSKSKTKNTLSICCVAASILLMSLPYGIPTGPKDYKTVFYQSLTTSYFHVSYGSNWFPIITAILSIAVLVMFIINYVKRNDYFRKYILYLFLFVSLLHRFHG